MTGKVIVMDHPLITHKINYVRQENVGTKEFREVIGEIAQLMCYEATRDLKMSRTYRSLQRSGDIRTGRILL